MSSSPKSDNKKQVNEDLEEHDSGEVARDEDLLRQIKKYLGDGGNSQQLAIGGVSGWVTGYMAKKIGKSLVAALGGSLILLHMCTRKGYIQINWSKLKEDLEEASSQFGRSRSGSPTPQLVDKAQHILRSNGYFSTGFAGGFLVALAL